LINSYIVEGKIVPVEITCQLLKKGMEKNGWDKKYFLIDGFPRNLDNEEGW
jgi:UMP-CMP kinase